MDYVKELKRLGADSRGELWTRPSLQDWAHTESDLCIKVPTDYKEIVTWFGAGSFGMSISLRNPCIRSGYCSLSRSTLGSWDNVIAFYPEERLPLFYSHGGTLCFMGFAGNSAEFYYALNQRGNTLEDLYIYDNSIDRLRQVDSMSQFIYDAYTGQLEHTFPGLRRAEWNEQIPFFSPSRYGPMAYAEPGDSFDP